MKIKIPIFIFLLILVLSCELFSSEETTINFLENVNNSIVNKNGWLIMIYISGSGNLEEESIIDINSIRDGYCNKNSDEQNDIDIVILHDRGPGFDTSDDDWTGTYLYSCGSEGLEPIESVEDWRVSIDQEENMGSSDTLDKFITWSKDNFHRSKNGLIIWNHGGGLSGQVLERSRAVSWDTENTEGPENDALYINEIQKVLSNHYDNDDKLEIIGFDACYMGMIEIAYEFKDLVSFMVASPGVETCGWIYHDFISDIREETTPLDLSKRIVETYKDYNDQNNLTNTLASLDLSQIYFLKEEIDILSRSLMSLDEIKINKIRENLFVYYDENILYENILYPYIDLGSLLDETKQISSMENESLNVIEALEKLIILSFGTEDSTNYYKNNSNRGLSIFFTDSKESYAKQSWYTGVESTTFGGVDFCLDNYDENNWKRLMDNLFISEGDL